ncbi:unnamed protein product [Rotaria magnacalcarata]|uniref:Uncharacterized protein n=1 Tax=Rotaria magnacalcarata TaxID=392030 RepID=A0A816RD43_9BILA|nr:unnamed protein product [Rotaria magnacalcarata]
MFIQGTTFALSFIRDLHNLTVIYKPNAFIYHVCQTSHHINFKRIRWHYESLYDSSNDTDTYCKRLFNNSDCFDFYYGTSTSVLVIKEPDMYIGKYSCHVNINSTYELTSSGYIDVKLPTNDIDDNDESMGSFNDKELGKLAIKHNVPFILDENDVTSFGKRIQIGGSFFTKCQSVQSSYPIHFLWIHLKNISATEQSEKIKTIRFIDNNDTRIKVEETKYSSSLFIHPVELVDDGDYICIASNTLGRSFSSRRSLIVTERMILPRIRDNLLNHSRIDLQHDGIRELICVADGYPEPEATWIRASDLSLLARNSTRVLLKFDNEMHGVNQYICEAKNKHGLTKVFMTVIIPDNQTKPLLSYSDIQSHSVLLKWRVSNGRYDRFNHFIIYYRRLHHFDDSDKEEINDTINVEDYKQVLIDPRTTRYSFTFRVMDLIPYTKYEFRLKGFIGATPSAYSNSVFIKTLETIPDKIDNLHGYVWNETSIVVHWTPPNSTNGPNFYYILYYTTNTSVPFDQWSHKIVRVYPFYVLEFVMSKLNLLFVRVASINAKGSILSDFHIINRSLTNHHLISTIDKFQCSPNDINHLFSIQWTIDYESRFYINKYIIYYMDITENNDDLIRQLIIPINFLSIHKHESYDLYKYEFNSSLFNLNYNSYHILRLNLAVIDQNQNHLSMTQPAIYCTVTRKYVPNNIRILATDKDFIRLSWTKPTRLSSPIYGYTIKYRAVNSNQSWMVKQTNRTEIFLSELRPITKYEIILQAYLNSSYTDSSGPLTRIEVTTDETVPLVAPINVSAYMINQTTANISWIYPLDKNNPDDISLLGGMIKGFYVIVFAPLSMQPPIVHRNYEGTIGTQYWDIVGNLTPGTTYHAQVKAFTKKGDGKPSVPYIFTVSNEDFRE